MTTELCKQAALLADQDDAINDQMGPDAEERGPVTVLKSLITGYETWLHHTPPERKQDSMTWKHLLAHAVVFFVFFFFVCFVYKWVDFGWQMSFL